MRGRFLALAGLAAALAATPAGAHHSTAMFDQGKEVALVGTVRELQWTNPHSWIQIVAPGPKGGPPVEWSVECGSPNTMSRQGWTKTTLKPGDKVTVRVNPMRDGTAAGLLVNVTLPNGKVLGQQGGPPPQAPAPR